MIILREISGPVIKGPNDVYRYLEEFKDQDREHFIVIGLDTKVRPCYREICHIGTLNSTLIHPREVFKKAITMSCSAIIVAHNHPSGDTEPSGEDIEITDRLKRAGELLGIKLLDHIVVSGEKFVQVGK